MIKGLRIHNFQSHTDSLLRFSPGVNVIIGQSDSGKTAVLRALDWVFNNRPQGDDFRREGEDTTEVTAILPEGEVKRWKRKTVDNAYSLGEQPFKAFGVDVPDEVRKVVRLSDLNLQRQLDAPFLLSLTPGEVARKLNAIVHLDVIDSSLSRINSKKLKNTQDLLYRKTEEARMEEELKGFEYLDVIEKMTEEAETLQVNITQFEQEIGDLYILLDRLPGLQENVEAAGRILRAEKTVKELEALQQQWKSYQEQQERLLSLGKAVRAHESAGRMATQRLETAPLVEECSQILSRITSVKSDRDGLKSIISYIETREERRSLFEKQMESLTKTLPTVCPTCGQSMKGAK